MTEVSRPWLPSAAVAVSVVLWSTAYGLSAVVLVTASPAVVAELRLLLAVPPLVALIALRRGAGGLVALGRALARPTTVLFGLTGVSLFYLPSNLGLALSTAGTASLMSASLPVFTALLAWLLLGERVTPRMLLGFSLTVVGVVAGSVGSAQFGLGALLLVGGLLSYAVYTVLLRRVGSRHPAAGVVADPVVLATATALWGAALLLPWLGWEAAAGIAAWPAGGAGWASILFLAVIVTGPTMALFSYGAERVPAAVAGTATGAVPALGYAFAVLLGEPVEAIKVAGSALALAGIVVAVLAPAPRAADAQPVSDLRGAQPTASTRSFSS
ncbi:MAG: DMT family transporter [Microbacterium sp.]|uniref:DMT family transporter n=1 Tax=Microbacterium sp. TaxID=51671 RepID=UPI0039E55226